MENIFAFNEIKISYTLKGQGPRMQSSKDVFDLMIPNWLDIDYCESFYVIMMTGQTR